jgi:hypothetical protein
LGTGRKIKIFTFRSSDRITLTNKFVNGVYSNTFYEYRWYDANKQNIYSLCGSHSSKEGNPPVQDTYHFALAAENAWSVFAYECACDKLERNATVSFDLVGDRALVLGNGFIEIINSNKSTRINTSEIDHLTIDRGIVTLRKIDAKSGFFGIGSSGIFQFEYRQIGNAKLFLMLFDALVGVNPQK